MRLGIDIGRVIIGATQDGVEDTSFLGKTVEEAMHSRPVTDSFDTIRGLVQGLNGAVWLVSKCGPSVERKTLLWLDHWGFFGATGLTREHLRFCRERHQKRVHTDQLGITHFIDDRVDVLQHLRGGVEQLFLFGEQQHGVVCPPWATPLITWSQTQEWFARHLGRG